MGKVFKGILILMVLFTFASLLSTPPANNTAPQSDDSHVSLQQASDASNTASGSTESNKTYAAPPDPEKFDVTTDTKKAEDPKTETRSINDPDAVDESDDSPSTSENIGASASNTATAPSYQDDEWRANVRGWMTPLSDDMKTLGTYTTNFDLEGMDSRARMLKSECGLALKDSQKYTVSPELEESKREYESSLPDFMIASDYIISAVEKFNNNEIEAGTEDIRTANVYINSGAEHMTNAAESVK